MDIVQEKIIEGNKVIGEFMGVKIGEYKYSLRIGVTEPLQEHHLAYHKEWGWLMPVVEKIEKQGHKTVIGGGDYWGNYCQIMYGKNDDEHKKLLITQDAETKALGKGESKVEAVWQAVIQFIIWFNNTQSK